MALVKMRNKQKLTNQTTGNKILNTRKLVKEVFTRSLVWSNINLWFVSDQIRKYSFMFSFCLVEYFVLYLPPFSFVFFMSLLVWFFLSGGNDSSCLTSTLNPQVKHGDRRLVSAEKYNTTLSPECLVSRLPLDQSQTGRLSCTWEYITL